jgi:probable HAF family extracellular repeat protein
LLVKDFSQQEIFGKGMGFRGRPATLCGLLLATLILDLPTSARAASLDDLGFLPGGSFSSATGISADGTTVVGYGNGSGAASGEAFCWTQGGGMVGIGFLPGGTGSEALGISADGSVVAGVAISASSAEAFRWTQGGGMIGLGFLSGGNNSAAFGISADGSTVVGQSNGTGVSEEAFRWRQGTGMVGLGVLSGGTNSKALAVNADGSAVVGYSNNASGAVLHEAFRWTQGGGMVGLGFLPGGNSDSAANGINADGSVVVGYSDSSSTFQEALRWTQGTGMQSVSGLLSGAGVDISNWSLNDANGVSANGNIIVGDATHNGNSVAYIANVATGGLTTPIDLSASLNSVAVAGRQATAMSTQNLAQNLFVARNLSDLATPMHAPVQLASNSNDWYPVTTPDTGVSVFMVGGYGTGSHGRIGNDNQFNGTAGFSGKVSDDLALGVGVIGGDAQTDLDFSGESHLYSKGGMIFSAYEPSDFGLRLYGSAYAAHLSMKTNRGYMNGSSLDSSQGDTDGASYGASAQLGWQAALDDRGTSIMPYVEGRYSNTTFDGYTEQGGGFASSFTKQESDYLATLVGVEVQQDLSNTLKGHVRVAAGRQLNGGGGNFTADTGGLIENLSLDGDERNWGELSLGASWQAMSATRFSLEATGRTGDTGQPDASIILGTSIGL